MFSLICAWINGWVNNREAGELRRHRAHYDVTVMIAADALNPWWTFWQTLCLFDEYPKIRDRRPFAKKFPTLVIHPKIITISPDARPRVFCMMYPRWQLAVLHERVAVSTKHRAIFTGPSLCHGRDESSLILNESWSVKGQLDNGAVNGEGLLKIRWSLENAFNYLAKQLYPGWG